MNLDTPLTSDRRQSPRYLVDFSVDLIVAEGDIFSVTARNISSLGLQVMCDSWTTDSIEPRGIQSHAVNQIRIKAITELPIDDNNNKLYANCRIMSVQRLSQDKYALNLAFIDFENGTEQSLNKFLNQYTQHKTIVHALA